MEEVDFLKNKLKRLIIEKYSNIHYYITDDKHIITIPNELTYEKFKNDEEVKIMKRVFNNRYNNELYILRSNDRSLKYNKKII